jgi:predicted metal-dependent HD superfamily phosphohydrolase
MTTDLSARWHRLTAPLVPDATRREAEFQRLTAAYQAPTRHYHNLKYLENLLARLDAAALQDRLVLRYGV